MSADEPRRLTPSERLHEVTMAVLSRQPAAPEHSIDITRNAKGDFQLAVTVRGHDLNVVIEQALAAMGELELAYPRKAVEE